jgi:hypothetical protein
MLEWGEPAEPDRLLGPIHFTMRLYRPRAEILGGRWSLPEAVPVE